MPLQIFFLPEAEHAIQTLRASEPFLQFSVHKQERTMHDIEGILEAKNIFENLKQTDGWENFLKDLPPFDRYLVEQTSRQQIAPFELSILCEEDKPFADFFPLFDKLPKELVAWIIYTEHTVEFRAPEQGAYCFRNTNIHVEKMIKGSVQCITITSPSIEEAIAAHAAIRSDSLKKNQDASRQAEIIRKISKRYDDALNSRNR